MFYLNSFKPLCLFKKGREAIKKFDLPPYIDASCRREPDFENPMPSISALCRGAGFAPRLRENDEIIYMTVKGSYGIENFRHRRLVAILKVKHKFNSHKEAAAFYQHQNLPLPNNCLVRGNDYKPFEMTGGNSPKEFDDISDEQELVKKWDSSYQKRARKFPTFLVCETKFLEIYNPPVITDEFLLGVFGRIPPTLTPPPISGTEFENVSQLCLKKLSSLI
jgi:hypothetical protein